jgi:adenylate cyclase
VNWLARHRRFAFAAICLFWTAIVFIGYFFPALPFISSPWRGEQAFEDLLRREGWKTPTQEDLMFVGIDQQSLQLDATIGKEEIAGNRAFELMTERPFPWSREVWALLLDRLFGAGARLVMFDMVFNNPNDGDPAFRAALDRYRDRVIVAMNFDMHATAEMQKQEGTEPTAIFPNSELIPSPAQKDDRVGFINYWNDVIDGKLRAARFYTSDRQLAGQLLFAGDDLYVSLPARALTKLGHGGDIPQDQRDHLFRFSSNDAYPPFPLWEIFHPSYWKANYGNGAKFKNKIVIIGGSAQIQHDVIDTPMHPATPGPVVHLQVIAATVEHEFLRQTPTAIMLGLVPLAGLIGWGVIPVFRRPSLSLLFLITVSVIYFTAARIAYDQVGFFLATVPVLSTLLLCGGSTLMIDYIIERMEKLRTRRTLERYVSKNLVKEILENPGSYFNSLKGSRMPATILFSDIVGFTTLSEKADPEELVRHLNEYLSVMTNVVFQNGGTLDKFIGDAIMAVWGNVKSQGKANDAKAAARTALAMRRELLRLNNAWQADGRMPLGMGVGINQGDVLAGNIGSQDRADLTVIGDAVNLASRLEGLTRGYGVDILIGPTAAELIRDEFYLRSVARAQVKGKSEPVDVFTIVDARDSKADTQLLTWLETYEEGIRKFRDRDFRQSKILFSRFLEFYPDDLLAKMYLERSLEYEQAPPGAAWNAVEVFERK